MSVILLKGFQDVSPGPEYFVTTPITVPTTYTLQHLSDVTVNSIADVDFTMLNTDDVTAVDFSHASDHITGGVDVINNFDTTHSGLVPLAGSDSNKYLRSDATWQSINAGPSEIITHSLNATLFPFNQLLIRNKEEDNSVPTSLISNFTITSINTTTHKMIVSDLPDSIDVSTSFSGEPWIIMNLDSWDKTTITPDGDCRAFFKITAVDVGTKEITYTYYNNGWAEASNLATHQIAFYNPFEDGFTRNTSNPMLDKSDFSGLGTYLYVSNVGYFWKQNGDFVIILTGVPAAGNPDCLFATTSNFTTFTPGGSILFATRPSWASAYLLPVGEAIYDSDEDMYFSYCRGTDGSTSGVGWIKFSEDFSTYEISPTVIFDHDNINMFLPSGTEITIGTSYPCVVENNDVWIMFNTVFTKRTGTHTGGNGVTTLEDTANFFEPSAYVTPWLTPVSNITQGTSGDISVNTLHTLTTDISWNTGDTYEVNELIDRRIAISTSNSKYGPFHIKEMVELNEYTNDGQTGSYYIYPSQAFVYKGEIYFTVLGQSKHLESGTKGNKVLDLYKYDILSNNLSCIKNGPLFTGLIYADKYGYSQYAWESDHLGTVFYVVDNVNSKLRIIYDATEGTNNYKIGIASKDLSTYL